MARITHSGPSFSDDELQDPDPPQVMRNNLPSNEDRPVPAVTRFAYGDEQGGGEEPSVGSNLSQSSGDAFSSSKTQTGTHLEPVQDAGSPSVHLEQELGDDAHSTDGDIQGTEEEFVDDEEIPPYSEWDYRDLQAECKLRKLVATGTQDELVARLEAFDKRHPAK